jgi:hypothetical protein
MPDRRVPQPPAPPVGPRRTVRRMGGRRVDDEFPKTTLTKKVLVVTVFFVDFFYLAVHTLVGSCNGLFN